MFFMDSSGGREMTLIAKNPVPLWGRASPKQKKQPRKRSQSVPILDQSNLMGIAQKVHVRLANELLEAKALLAQERERSATMRAELGRGDTQPRASMSGSLANLHFLSLRSPAHANPEEQTAQGATEMLSPQPGRLSPMKASSRPSHTHPNPTRYASPPRADARSAHARGRGLDPITSVSRTATWRLQNQWLGGLRWREVANEESQNEGIDAHVHDGQEVDTSASHAAKRRLDQRLAELEAFAGGGGSRPQHLSSSPSPKGNRPALSNVIESRAASEAHVAGVKRARLQAFQECFNELVSTFRIYSPLLSRVKREFDALIDAFEACIDDVTARKVEPVATQTSALQELVSSSEKLIEDLERQIHALEIEAQQREDQVKHLTQTNSEMKTMVSTRQIQSRRGDQDFIKQSMRNDTLTMQIKELQSFRAKQSSTRQQIHKSQQASLALQQEETRFQEEEAELQSELTMTEAEVVERYTNLRQLVQQHCAQTGETWSEVDLERVLLESEGVGDKPTSEELFASILCSTPGKAKMGRTKSLFVRMMPHAEDADAATLDAAAPPEGAHR